VWEGLATLTPSLVAVEGAAQSAASSEQAGEAARGASLLKGEASLALAPSNAEILRDAKWAAGAGGRQRGGRSAPRLAREAPLRLR
jgi:hypothetical protein